MKLTKVILALILCFGFLLNVSPKSSEAATTVPTIFLHGYNGGLSTFDTMINNFEKKGKMQKTMVIKVEKNGKLEISNKKALGKNKKPLIQVYFVDNKASFQNQLTWIKSVTAELSKEYKTNSVNIIGHSMGGVIATKYIIETAKDSKYPNVNKLVTLASPIEGATYFVSPDPASKDLQPNSNEIKKLYNNRSNFPNNVKVYSVYGWVDTVVGKISAIGLQKFTKNIKVDSFYDNHTSIHQHTKVINATYNFINN